MDPERRARIIAESIKNLERFQNETGLASADSAWPDDAEAARPVDGLSSCRRPVDPPPEDPVARWRREGEAIERMLAQGRAELRREEQRHRQNNNPDWGEIDRRVEAAVSRNLEPIMEVLREALQACNEANEAHNNAFDQIDAKLAALSKLLEQVREGNEQSQRRARDARARADEVLDLPPVPLVTKLN